MPKEQLTVPAQVARRFVLGRQGLWPGRRWSGPEGVEQAMRAVEHLQLDPLNITARSQDLMLHARVAGYEPEAWQHQAYGRRRFFDWGGWLAVRPMEELPYFRRYMVDSVKDPAMSAWLKDHPGLLDEMRTALREEGPLSNRDFDMSSRKRVNSYRGRKDSAVALYNLWRMGDVMIHDRNRFERVYDLTERIAPTEFIYEAPAHDTERFMMLKNVAFNGIRNDQGTYPVPGAYKAGPARALLQELAEGGELRELAVEGQRGKQYILSSDMPLLEELMLGRVPAAWRPLGETTEEAVTFLAPLDPVSARGRSAKLFGFDYVWEVYKPVEKRIWGYYVLPILWGDSLVARSDLKLDRATNTLQVLGFWLEERATGKDAGFATAFGHGLGNLQRFVGAAKLDLTAVRPVALRTEARKAAKNG
ncbi:MAG: crosslink repair DNA glycosylase YcaQ family protein [Trueperaceae bacterium]